VMSGNGVFAWGTTKTNRLLRIDLNQGSVEEILSLFPASLYPDTSPLVPGSAWTLFTPPVPGEHFISNDLEFPILSPAQTDRTVVQVPWEFAAQLPAQGTATVPLLVRKDGYPFEVPLGVSATGQITPALQPLQVPGKPNIVKAAPSDFSYLIDYDHPAIAGQTIVVWLTGLGPLDQPVPTGVPGPTSPPAHPLAHLECGLAGHSGSPGWRGLVLPFVGYAPALVGVYQVNVTIPSDWPAGLSDLNCYVGAVSSVMLLPVAAAQ
jgi:uncharacterized protein (TIGR03437 family)